VVYGCVYDVQNVIIYQRSYFVQRNWTPLHMAAQHGHVEVAESLIRSGAVVSAVEKVIKYC